MLGKKTEQKTEAKTEAKTETFEETSEEKKRVYKAGPFALFYELNESKLDKDD